MIPEGWRQGEVAVVGLGRSGRASSRWLLRQGVAVYASDVASHRQIIDTANELRSLGAAVDVGGHDLRRIAEAAALVVSPGVPPDAAPLASARRSGVEIVAELDLGARILEQAKLIAVTGTNGKTTTTALIVHLLRAAGFEAAAAGNIGRPLTELALDQQWPEWIAVEASSFQLHDAPHLAPRVGVLTNLAPDHLDRYPDVASYYADKRLLFRNAESSSVWVVNADDGEALGLTTGVVGLHRRFSLIGPADAWFDRERAELVMDGTTILSRSRLQLLGDHNVANALAGALAAAAAHASADAIAHGLETFTAPAHRLEPIRTVRSISWVNDSKATNVAATSVALRAMAQPFVLILGGRPKGERFDVLRVGEHCRAVVAYGEAAAQIASEVGASVDVDTVDRFEEAITRAAELATPGDTVLLSPACASFDQFGGFAERGDRFREIVEAW